MLINRSRPVFIFSVKNTTDEMQFNVSILQTVEKLFGSNNQINVVEKKGLFKKIFGQKKKVVEPIQIESLIKGVSMNDIYVAILLKPFHHIVKTIVQTNVNKFENVMVVSSKDTSGTFVQIPFPLEPKQDQEQKNIVVVEHEYMIDKFTEIKIQQLYPGEVLQFHLFEKALPATNKTNEYVNA